MASEDKETCKSTTTDDTPCELPAQDDGYCYLHGPDDGTPEADEVESEDEEEEEEKEETVRVRSNSIGYVAPGAHFDSTREVKELELTTPIKKALEEGDLERAP